MRSVHACFAALLAAASAGALHGGVASAATAPAAAASAAGAMLETAAARDTPGLGRWRREARAVSIVRDPWGIAHVYGQSDAEAVFGMIYAQAEDDFHRIERNYLVALGRLAEAEGESAIYSDLRQRLFTDPQQLEEQFRKSPAWLKSLMQAWADGLNFYLAGHPLAKPAVITRFEPWMALSFTEGSIGGDIETVDLAKLARFYSLDKPHAFLTPLDAEPPALGGSNGFAIASALSASGHALLWINPHTSFYFRSEVHMSSAQGLDVYGAATWGQFFIYQGFNEHNGWMHTSYGGDAIDEYAETVIDTPRGLYYRYAGALRPLKASRITIKVKSGGGLIPRGFTVYHSHHGPIVRSEGGKWIAVKILQTPARALAQSYLRTKTRDYRAFRETQEMRTDTSNNTVYADADGTIAYFHGNFIPKRDPRFDFTRPVDGSNPATEWQGPHRLEETITLLNPANGWIQNTNNWPFSAAGADSPKRESYPAYMWRTGENPRGLHAVEVLKGLHDVTLDSLIAAAYDGHLTAFEVLLPPLLDAYDRLSADDPRQGVLKQPIASLRAWDRRTAADSAPTALAIFWGQELIDKKISQAKDEHAPIYDYLVAHLTDDERLDALRSAVARLERDFGRWRVAWGEVNRFQRLTDDIVQPFDDAKPSLPVGFAPGQWGALASFDSSKPRTTKRIYGSSGNSFVAAVEFGPVVRAKAIMTGGESGELSSPHFVDQAQMYSEGRFRDVIFTREDVAAHAVRRYHPGEP
jgi:acyl-homoserine-lactone acylase